MICLGLPGVAKLGIALGSGPRDRGFKSRRSDHVGAKSALLRHFFAKNSIRSAPLLLLSRSDPLHWAPIRSWVQV